MSHLIQLVDAKYSPIFVRLLVLLVVIIIIRATPLNEIYQIIFGMFVNLHICEYLAIKCGEKNAPK